MHLILSDRSLVIDLERGQIWELLFPHFEIIVPDVLWERHFNLQEKNRLRQAGLNVRGLSEAEVRLATHFLRQIQSKGISAADAFALVLAQTPGATLLTHNPHLFAFAQEQKIVTQTLKGVVEPLIVERGALAQALQQKLTFVCQSKHCRLPCQDLLNWLTLELARL